MTAWLNDTNTAGLASKVKAKVNEKAQGFAPLLMSYAPRVHNQVIHIHYLTPKSQNYQPKKKIYLTDPQYKHDLIEATKTIECMNKRVIKI